MHKHTHTTQTYVNSHMHFPHKPTPTHKMHTVCACHILTCTFVHVWLGQLILQFSCMGILCYEMYNSFNTVSCCPSGALRQLFVGALVHSLCIFLCVLDVCDGSMACVFTFSAHTHVIVICSCVSVYVTSAVSTIRLLSL